MTEIRRYPDGSNVDACQRTDFTYDEGDYGWGRLTSVAWGGDSCTGGAWSQSYDYTTGGLVSAKTQNGGGFDLQAEYTYNNEGKLVSTQYPYDYPMFTYTYDALGRPIKLTDHQSTPVDWAKDVAYNAAGQITQMKYTRYGDNSAYYTETRGYNVLQQMTQLTVSRTSTILDYRYSFSDTQNDGRITQRQELVSGETVQYQYDSLKRLISAATTGPEWGQSFTEDGLWPVACSL